METAGQSCWHIVSPQKFAIMLLTLIRKERILRDLAERLYTQKVLDFISGAWGDLSNLKLLWESVFSRSLMIIFALIRTVGV